MCKRLLLLAVTLPLLLGARVYQKVGPDGSVTFSDQPSPGAEEVQVSPLPAYEEPVVPRPAKDSAAKEVPFRYTSFTIERPRNEEVLRQDVGNVEVQMLLKPPLQEGMAHRIVIFVDDEPALKNETSPRLQLTNVDSGRHKLHASVVDAKGKKLISAAPVTFDLQIGPFPAQEPPPSQEPLKTFKLSPPSGDFSPKADVREDKTGRSLATAAEKQDLFCPDHALRGQAPTQAELELVLQGHEAWLSGFLDGKGKSAAGEGRANLCGTLLKGVDLQGAQLSHANLSFADFTGASLMGAQLNKAALWGAKLVKAQANKANLSGAQLGYVDLSEANLVWTDLSGASLNHANLQNANLRSADLAGALYVPPAGKLPIITELFMTRGLDRLRVSNSPRPLVELRNAFREAGMRTQERQITYAIKRWEREKANSVESALNLLLFEWPSGYGMQPGRPLKILLALIVLCSVLYMSSIYDPRPRSSGIWRVWPQDGVRPLHAEPQRLTVEGLRALLWGLWFSVLSAFHIGWRDLSVGNWLVRVMPGEYTLRATGRTKVISGIQSLLSVYLVVLSLLTYFGRPFQ